MTSSMHFRLRYRVLGGHTHVRVFAGPTRKSAHGRCGELILTNEEWAAFSGGLAAYYEQYVPPEERFVEVVKEDEPLP